MNKALPYIIGFLGAVFAAIILLVLARDEFGISPQSIIFNSLSSAGILSMACVVGALRTRKYMVRNVRAVLLSMKSPAHVSGGA